MFWAFVWFVLKIINTYSPKNFSFSLRPFHPQPVYDSVNIYFLFFFVLSLSFSCLLFFCFPYLKSLKLFCTFGYFLDCIITFFFSLFDSSYWTRRSWLLPPSLATIHYLWMISFYFLMFFLCSISFEFSLFFPHSPQLFTIFWQCKTPGKTVPVIKVVSLFVETGKAVLKGGWGERIRLCLPSA